MPEKRFTATEEMMLRIKALDAEESYWMKRLETARTDVRAAEVEVEKIGNLRRQYEFSLVQLGEKPPIKIEHEPSEPIPVPVGHGLIVEL